MYAHLWVTYDILFSGERLGSRLGNWEMPLVLSKVWVPRLDNWEMPLVLSPVGFAPWKLGDATRPLKKNKKKKNKIKKKIKKKFLCSRLDNWEMPLVLSKVWVHDLATGRCPSCSLKFGFAPWQLGDATRPQKKKKKKKIVFTTWHLGDANRALYSLGSRLGNWEMPIVLSNLIGTRAKKWGLYVYISIYIILWTINTSTTNIPASATYMTAIPRVTTREWFPAHRPCVLHVLHSFSPYRGLFPFISL